MEEGAQIGLILGIVIGLVMLTACAVVAFSLFVLGWVVL